MRFTNTVKRHAANLPQFDLKGAASPRLRPVAAVPLYQVRHGESVLWRTKLRPDFGMVLYHG